jgi:hypothetical protein
MQRMRLALIERRWRRLIEGKRGGVRRERAFDHPRRMAQGHGGEAGSKDRGETRQPLPGLRLRVERLPRRQDHLEHQVRHEEGLVRRK